MAITHATAKRNRIDTQHFHQQRERNDVTVINLLFLNFTPVRMGICTHPTPSVEPHPHIPRGRVSRHCGSTSVCARSGTLIHNFLPHSPRRSARSLTLPSRRTATSRAARLRPSQRTLSTTVRIAYAMETRCEAGVRRSRRVRARDSKASLPGQLPPWGRRSRASIEAWQSSPPFRFRAPCPASPS